MRFPQPFKPGLEPSFQQLALPFQCTISTSPISHCFFSLNVTIICLKGGLATGVSAHHDSKTLPQLCQASCYKEKPTCVYVQMAKPPARSLSRPVRHRPQNKTDL